MKLYFLIFFFCFYSISSCSQEIPDSPPSVQNLYLFSKKVDGGIYPDYKLYGYVNADKEIIIDAKYDFAEPFEGNVAKVAMIEKVPDRWNCRPNEQLMWGLIDMKDSTLIDFNYYELKSVNDGNFAGLGLFDSYLFNHSGDTLKKLLHNVESDKPFADSLISVRNNIDRTMGIMDSNYNYIVKPDFTAVSEPSGDRFLVYNRTDKEDYIGYLDMEGHIAIPLIYSAGGNFTDGSALVRNRQGKVLLLNKKGDIISEIDQEYIDSRVNSGFSSSDFDSFKTCTKKLKYQSIYFGFINCSSNLFGDEVLKKSFETCPGPIGGECSSTTTYGIYRNAYFKTVAFYEGFPRIDIYLANTDLESAQTWSETFMNNFGFQVEFEKESPQHDSWLNFTHSEYSSKGEITINCDSLYCKIRPFATVNY